MCVCVGGGGGGASINIIRWVGSDYHCVHGGGGLYDG